MAYLDYNARAPLRAEAKEAMLAAALLEGNPSSLHAAGQKAREAVENARAGLADLLESQPENIIFTSGGTEANYLALAQAKQCAVCLVGASEHPSLLEAARQTGVPVELLPVDETGGIAPETLTEALARHQGKGRVFVSIMLANHETGRIHPVAELVEQTHAMGGLFHCDAVQGFGKVPLTMPALGADYVSLAAAKIGGAPGCGALVLREDNALTPLFAGGQERGRRAGSENLLGIAGFYAAASAAVENLATFAELAKLRDALEDSARRHFANAEFFAANAPRLANTSLFTLSEIPAQQSLIMLDLAGISLSAGAACASGKNEPSHILQAMGVPPNIAQCALRASLGWGSTPDCIHQFDAALANIAQRRAAA